MPSPAPCGPRGWGSGIWAVPAFRGCAGGQSQTLSLASCLSHGAPPARSPRGRLLLGPCSSPAPLLSQSSSFHNALSILDINRPPRSRCRSRCYVNAAGLCESLGVAGAMCPALPLAWHCPWHGTAPGTAFPGSGEGSLSGQGWMLPPDTEIPPCPSGQWVCLDSVGWASQPPLSAQLKYQA